MSDKNAPLPAAERDRRERTGSHSMRGQYNLQVTQPFPLEPSLDAPVFLKNLPG
jgi:hypothetical protein